jgi:hypothetical protein
MENEDKKLNKENIFNEIGENPFLAISFEEGIVKFHNIGLSKEKIIFGCKVIENHILNSTVT